MGGIMGSGLTIVNECGYIASAQGVTSEVGHVYNQAQIVYDTAAAVNGGIAAVTDITDPTNGADDWTDIINLTGSPMLVIITGISAGIGNANRSAIAMSVDTGETADDALRAQILVDGNIKSDLTCTRNAAGDATVDIFGPNPSMTLQGTAVIYRFYCTNSFVLRAAREGTMEVDDTEFAVGPIQYDKLEG